MEYAFGGHEIHLPDAARARASLRIRAAFEIASEAHAASPPRKNSGEDYITHPLLVYHLLDRLGATHSQKAVALLHDTVEDYPAFEYSAENLRKAYSQRLERLYGDAGRKEPARQQEWVGRVCRQVGELSNERITYEGKRTSQADDARTMDKRTGAVKICDQAASVIDDILYTDPRDQKAMERTLRFALKGYDIAGIVANYNRDNVYFDLYAHLYIQLQEIYQLAKAARQQGLEGNYDKITHIRETWKATGLEALLESTRNRTNPPIAEKSLPERITYIYHPDKDINKGIQRISVSRATGKVVRFACVVDETDFASSSPNKMADALRLQLELLPNLRIHTEKKRPAKQGTIANQQNIHMIEQGDEIYANHLRTRIFRLHPPLDIRDFLNAARADTVNAVDHRMAAKLEKYVAKHNILIQK